MKFENVSQSDLRSLVNEGGYPGGTAKTTLDELKAYIKGKTLKDAETKDTIKATEAYEYCSYVMSNNVRAAEDRLLATCSGQSCRFNHHRRSNLPDEEGIVYVLHD